MPTPALTPENELIFAVWIFANGWQPGLFASAFEYYDVQDRDYALAALEAMHARIEVFKRQARGGK